LVPAQPDSRRLVAVRLRKYHRRIRQLRRFRLFDVEPPCFAAFDFAVFRSAQLASLARLVAQLVQLLQVRV
jgi:hypothetical protein